MPDHQELADKLTTAIDNVRYRFRRRMLTGRRLDDNTVSLADAPLGKVWVRGTDQSREQTAVWGYTSSINVPVVIDKGFDGESEVVGVNYVQGVPVFGDAIHGVTTSPAGDDLTTRSIAGIGFKPGRLRVASQGGMFVTAESFYHSGGFWDGSLPTDDLDLTSDIPSTSGAARWVLVYLDPATNTLAAADGTEEPYFGAGLLETTIRDIVLPDGMYPLGAITLTEGMTAINPASPMIADTRWHLEHSGATTAGFYQTIQDNGSDLAQEAKVNFVSGTGITLTIADDSGNNRTNVQVATSGSTAIGDYILFRDKKTQNTSGGTATSGSWQTRDLNEEVVDTGNYASISSNQIILAAGTYRANIVCPARTVNRHQARLQDITNTATLLLGTSAFSAAAGDGDQNFSYIHGRFTLAGSTVIEVQHRFETTSATRGLGVESNFADEIYTVVEFIRE